MIVKKIEVRVRPGHLPAYHASQAIWNRETEKSAGLIGHFCGHEPGDPERVTLLFFWRSRAELDQWMATHHDRIARQAQADAHYLTARATILEPIESLPATDFIAR